MESNYNRSRSKAKFHKMFEDDVMCARCARWYAPQILNDENEGICPSCQKQKQHSNKQTMLIIDILSKRLQALRSEWEDDGSPSYVYFLYGRETKRMKVGYSVDPYTRLRDLQIGSPDFLTLLGVLVAPPYFEKEIQNVLYPFHSHGEWYDTPIGLVRWIKKNTYFPRIEDDADETELR